MLVATTFFWLPAESDTVFAQNGQNKSKVNRKQGNVGKWQPGKSGRNWNRGRKATHGYKNYGQYRRTQVGNRRYRVVKRYYWNDGIRLSRFVRVYY
jgi:hypothetical protein